MENTLLDIQGLSKKYKKFSLGPLDLKVEQGIVVGLVGANGSGKSTLFRLIMNLLKEDTGTVRVFGQEWNKVDWKDKIGYAGELYEAYDFLSLKEIKNLISRWYKNWNDERFEQLVNRYKLDLDQKYGKCSKGMKKKADFIFSLCHNPQLLILDEPTAGVDLVSQRRMKEDLIEFMEDGNKSILLATHTVDEINQLCDEIVVLDSGRLVHLYNKDEIHNAWGRVWVSQLTETIKKHPNVIDYGTAPAQIVTDNVTELENVLAAEQITVIQRQRLSMDEVLEYLIEGR